MIHSSTSLNNVIHFEPLTELALQRFNVDLSRGDASFDNVDPGSIKDINFIVDLIKFYSDPRKDEIDQFEEYSLDVILDYLQRTHKFYINILLPKMEMTIKNIFDLFPEHNFVPLLKHFFEQYENDLLEHIELEERCLFPYAKKLMIGELPKDYSVHEFCLHHDHRIQDYLEDIILLIEEDIPTVNKTFAYRVFKNLLTQFKTDLHIHHMIEEKVFLNKLTKLESHLKAKL